jgi:hypothetical protein
MYHNTRPGLSHSRVPAPHGSVGTPLLLPLAQTGNEALVGLDAGAFGAHEGVSLVVSHAVLADEICDHHRG